MTLRAMPWLSAVLLTLTLSACVGDPWVDARRDAALPGITVGQSTPDRVAICHAPSESLATLQALAALECAKTDRAPVYAGTMKWQCALAAPHHSFFDCR